MMHNTPCPLHEQLRAEIQRDIEEYLARGGKITVCPPGATTQKAEKQSPVKFRIPESL